MTRKSLTVILLILSLLMAQTPVCASADEYIAYADNTAQYGENLAEEPEAEAFELRQAVELPADGSVRLRFRFDPASDSAIVTVLNAIGETLRPVSDEDGSVYLLAPGAYSYFCHDPSGRYEDLPETPLLLEENTERVDVTLRLTPRAESETEESETLKMPVIFQSEGNSDFRGLTVTDERGETLRPYDPGTGEIQYQNYLLEPGEYRYSFHDYNGRFRDERGRFTVDDSGVQVVALELRRITVGLCFSGAFVNPCYDQVIGVSAIPAPLTSAEDSLDGLMRDFESAGERADGRSISEVFAAGTFRESSGRSSPVTYDNAPAAGAALRRGLFQRQREVCIRVRCALYPTEEVWWGICSMIYEEAIRHTGAPTEGDYLRYEYGGVNCTGSAVGPDDAGDTYYEFVYAPLYFTTPEQEAELSGCVAGILNALHPAGKSDEQKIRAVYQYLCDNVGYDYADDTIVFTAYDALVNGRAVCQGVAVAFYRLCLELGVDARIVTSVEMGHAWNIACADGAHYFALDPTWDAGRGPEEWGFYLRGRESWQREHTLGDEFLSGKFNAYSFPDEDYGDMDAAFIHSVSVVFDGLLRIKYYFLLPDWLTQTPGACLQFSREGEIVSTVPLSAGVRERDYLCYYCGVNPEDIGTPVLARLLDGSGENVVFSTESGSLILNGFSFSAMKYATEMKNSASTGTMRTLARALEDYGIAAQNYFKKQNGALREEVTAVTAADLAPWRAQSAGEKPAGFTGASISVLFEADNSLRVYFAFDSGRDVDGYSFTVDGRRAVPHIKSSGDCYLSVENISADELDRAHSFSISDGTGTFTVTASALSYAGLAVERGEAGSANLGRALYLYNRAADANFGVS